MCCPTALSTVQTHFFLTIYNFIVASSAIKTMRAKNITTHLKTTLKQQQRCETSKNINVITK